MAAWTNVTKAEAQENKLYGFWGWLFAFYAYAIVECCLPMIGLFGEGEGLVAMYGADNLGMMRMVMAANMVLPLPFLILAPLKHRLMPLATIITFWASAILFLVAMTIGGVDPQTILTVVSLNALTAAAYTWYVLRSKRVNVTYRHRLPA
jgi:hypothetical protein